MKMDKKETYESGKARAKETVKEILNMENWESFLEGFLDEFENAFGEEKDDSVGMPKV